MTADRLRQAIRYEPDTGLFFWRERRPGRRRDGTAGSVSKVSGYVQIGIDGRLFSAHRLAILYMTGEDPSGEIDHINGIRSDNRFANLRDVTRKVNNENRRAPSAGSTSGLLGVTFCPRTRRWRASIGANYRKIRLGRFDTPEQAHAAYLRAKRTMHEGNTL